MKLPWRRSPHTGRFSIENLLPKQSCVRGEITEEAQPLTHGKGRANHQIDKFLLFQRKTDYLSPPMCGFTKLPATQISKLLDLTPHASNEGFNFSLLSSQQERALGLMWAMMFSQKPFCFCPHSWHFSTHLPLHPPPFSLVLPALSLSLLLPCWMVFSHHFNPFPRLSVITPWACLQPSPQSVIYWLSERRSPLH